MGLEVFFIDKVIGENISSHSYWAERRRFYIETLAGSYHLSRFQMIHALISGVSLDDAVCIYSGCGEGTFVEFLLKGGAWRVNGFNTGQVPIQTALEKLGINGERVSLHVDGIKHTVDSFSRHLSVDDLQVDVRSLLRNPDLPDRRTFNVPENPLAFKYKLASFGFRELRQEFAHFHHTPLLLSLDRGPDDINAHVCKDTLGWRDIEKWKLMFMCSMFGSHSIRASRI